MSSNEEVTVRNEHGTMVMKMSKPFALHVISQTNGKWSTDSNGKQRFTSEEDLVWGNSYTKIYFWNGYQFIMEK